MGTPAQDEEAERIRKAHDNVAAWQKKWIGDEGFSGGVRMTVETQDGILASSERRFGTARASQIIAAPLDKPVARSQIVRAEPLPETQVTKQIIPSESWLRRLFNYLFKGKPS